MAVERDIQLQMHLAPKEPIAVYELTAALSSMWRQYSIFAEKNYDLAKPSQIKLFVSSVSPGSIDISLLPDLKDALAISAPIVSQLAVVNGFANHVKELISTFSAKKADPGKDSDDITVKDCDYVINITKPVAEHGGTQTFNVYKGPVLHQTFNVTAPEARQMIESAGRKKAELQFPEAERHQRVPMVWNRLDRNPAKQQGSSPDKAVIYDIDERPRSVFFTDELSYLKKDMVEGESQPFQKVYHVDVEVSRVNGKVMSYRVVGYHGSDDLEEEDQQNEED